MRWSSYHVFAALGYFGLAAWWAFLAFLLAGFLGPFGWLPLGLAGIALVGAFDHVGKMAEVEPDDLP